MVNLWTDVQTWVGNDTVLGTTTTKDGRRKIEWCKGYTTRGGSNCGHFWIATKENREGDETQLVPYLQSNRSKQLEILCHGPSFYYQISLADLPLLPYKKALREEAAKVFSRLQSVSFTYTPSLDNGNDSTPYTFAEPVLQNFTSKRERLSSSSQAGGRGRGASLGVHWRRTDLTKKIGLSTVDVAHSINLFIKQMNVRRIFIATDATESEVKELRSVLWGPVLVNCIKESPLCRGDTVDRIAIEQTVCAMTDYFLGSPVSTFAKRIALYRTYFGYSLNSSMVLEAGKNVIDFLKIP
jgi:hypothetical protein